MPALPSAAIHSATAISALATQSASPRRNGAGTRRQPGRLSALDILRLNPALHRDSSGKPIHMQVSPAIARFIGEHVRDGQTTIETGAGMSTLCFLAQGAIHTAIAPDPGLEGRIRAFCGENGLREIQLTYIPKRSQECVWAVEGEYQCVLIDGGHGFPIPFLDFYYLQRRLKVGGYLIIDDLEIWTGETLAKFLSCEPAWKPVMQDGARAIVFQRVAETREGDWTAQEFVVKNSLHPFYLASLVARPTPTPTPTLKPASPAPVNGPGSADMNPAPPKAPAVVNSTAATARDARSRIQQPVPDAARVYLRQADEALARQDLKGSQTALELALQTAPSHVPILTALANVTFQLRDFTGARRYFQRVTALDPGDPLVLAQLGITCLELEDIDGFEAAIQGALAIHPDCPEVLNLLADLNQRSGRYAAAADLYRRLLIAQPGSVTSLLGLAKCRFHLGERQASQALYLRVLAMEPANEVALEAVAILEGRQVPGAPAAPASAPDPAGTNGFPRPSH